MRWHHAASTTPPPPDANRTVFWGEPKGSRNEGPTETRGQTHTFHKRYEVVVAHGCRGNGTSCRPYRTGGNGSHRQLPFRSCPWPKRRLPRFARNDMIGDICGSGRHGFLLSQEGPSRIGVHPYCKGAAFYSSGRKDRQKEGEWSQKKRKKPKRKTSVRPFLPHFPFFGYGGFRCSRRPRRVLRGFAILRSRPLRFGRSARSFAFLFTNFLSAYVARA